MKIIKVRRAKGGELETVLRMAVNILHETKLDHHAPPNENQLAKTFSWLYETPDAILLVAEDDGKICGTMGGYVHTHPISGERVAAEIFWWVNREYRTTWCGAILFRHFEKWAYEMGADIVQVTAPTSALCEAYPKLGYEQVEVGYQRRLSA